MATHSSTLAWKIPWTGETGRLQSDSQTRLAEQQQQVGLKLGRSKMIPESPTMVRTILNILKGYHNGKLFLQSPDILSALWARQSLL